MDLFYFYSKIIITLNSIFSLTQQPLLHLPQVRLITHSLLSSGSRCRLKIGNNVLSPRLFPSVGGKFFLDVLDLSDSLINNSLFLTIMKRWDGGRGGVVLNCFSFFFLFMYFF